jgi:hypothetical protein
LRQQDEWTFHFFCATQNQTRGHHRLCFASSWWALKQIENLDSKKF